MQTLHRKAPSQLTGLTPEPVLLWGDSTDRCTTLPLLVNPLQLNIFQVNLLNVLHTISDPAIHRALAVELMLALAFCWHLLLQLTPLTHFRVSGKCKCLSRRCSWLETAAGHVLCFCRRPVCFSVPDWLKTNWDVNNTYCTIFSFPHKLGKQ